MPDRIYDLTRPAENETQKVFEDIQCVCMGNSIVAVLQALLDSLTMTLIVASPDIGHAMQTIDTLPKDLALAVQKNWDDVKRQIADARDAGNA
jgi:hypothetical protein